MPLVRSVLTALVVIFWAHDAFAMAPVQSDTQFYAGAERRSPAWTTANLCNGISKATRTICCGTSPPAWCGKRPDRTAIGDAFRHGLVVPLLATSASAVRQFVSDPMFYVCMMTAITIIYLAALAASGRDDDIRDGV
jgi:hypothetical protein